MDDVRQREAKAIAAENDGDFATAIELWHQILTAYPNWEHGYAHYHLANCYFDAGQVDLALGTYRQAMEISPNDTMFSDAYNGLLEARRLGHV